MQTNAIQSFGSVADKQLHCTVDLLKFQVPSNITIGSNHRYIQLYPYLWIKQLKQALQQKPPQTVATLAKVSTAWYLLCQLGTNSLVVQLMCCDKVIQILELMRPQEHTTQMLHFYSALALEQSFDDLYPGNRSAIHSID